MSQRPCQAELLQVWWEPDHPERVYHLECHAKAEAAEVESVVVEAAETAEVEAAEAESAETTEVELAEVLSQAASPQAG